MYNKTFDLKANRTNFKTEVLAGITTFITGMYIIVVNPSILKDTGISYTTGLTATVLLSAFCTIAMG